MKDNTNWRFIIGFPIILQIFTIINVSRFFKDPSIIDLLESEEPDSNERAEEQLRRVYIIDET